MKLAKMRQKWLLVNEKVLDCICVTSKVAEG